MARVRLDIADPITRITLATMLKAEGHTITDGAPHVAIFDDTTVAIAAAGTLPTLVLASASEVREAVAAMREGVYGYIFMPLQPGEAGLMVRRATQSGPPDTAAPAHIPSLEEVEDAHVLDVLRRRKYNHSEAARLLGIGRNTLWRKLKRIKEKEEATAQAGPDEAQTNTD